LFGHFTQAWVRQELLYSLHHAIRCWNTSGAAILQLQAFTKRGKLCK